MAAGDSAAAEAQINSAMAEELERMAALARLSATAFNAGSVGERRLADALQPLDGHGWRILADRRWPGSRRANIDFLVIGPGGVFVVDAKNWREVGVEHLGGELRVLRGQADVTDEIARLADLAHAVEGEFAEMGVAPGEVHAIAALTGSSAVEATVMTVEVMSAGRAFRRIVGSPRRFTAEQVDRLTDAARDRFAPCEALAEPVTIIVKPVIVTPASATPRATLVPERLPASSARSDRFEQPEHPELISVEEVHEAMLAGLAMRPIEEWMAFLHPDQARVVRRSFRGPSRIRGAAGTGKTVVGLHRAAYLARSAPGRVLVTTFVRTLPDVLRSLMERLAPDVAGRVDFVHVHGFAKQVLVDRGVRYRIDPRSVDRAWRAAWQSTGRNRVLGRLDPDERYWRDEVENVIKGRGLVALSQYEACARPGRRRGLTAEQRRAVWELFEAYERELGLLGTWDAADVINAADTSLRETPLPGYSAVVVDEAQDLSCAMIRLLHRVVGDGPDGLTLIGDGQQTIYPGGYTLAELGISLAGRGVVMTRNYRNTIEIADFAASIVSGDDVTDIEGGSSAPDAAEVLRHGIRPQVRRFSNRAAHDQSFVQRIREVTAVEGTSLGDVGVLASATHAVADAIAALGRAGIPAVDLQKYDGHPVDAVKVGTIKRAKGLEFKQVLVVRARLDLLGGAAADRGADVVDRERRDLDRRELYVAMTRARDGLWVSVG